MVEGLPTAWLSAREELLIRRTEVDRSGIEAASSGCAEDGAHRLAHRRSDDAVLALARLRAGEAGICMTCGGQIPQERLDAVVTAVRCATC